MAVLRFARYVLHTILENESEYESRCFCVPFVKQYVEFINRFCVQDVAYGREKNQYHTISLHHIFGSRKLVIF